MMARSRLSIPDLGRRHLALSLPYRLTTHPRKAPAS
jgi:hypothetical protein